MNIYGKILKQFGWTVEATTPEFPKSIICVAPHTSNWDFILCEFAIRSVNRHSGFLMKSSWFFFPLGYLLKAMGGIPVVRKNKKVSLVDSIIEKFKTSDNLTIAITPEGTRKRVEDWRTGFLRIAYGAKVPLQLAALDFKKKIITLTKVFEPSGNLEEDIAAIKEYYKNCTALYPEKFAI